MGLVRPQQLIVNIAEGATLRLIEEEKFGSKLKEGRAGLVNICAGSWTAAGSLGHYHPSQTTDQGGAGGAECYALL